MAKLRSLSRGVSKHKGKLTMKKVVSRKLGLSVKELNKRYFKEDKGK